MPIEVRELVIKTTVTEPGQTRGNSSGNGAAAGDQKTIVKACVEQVLKILQQKRER